MMNIEETTNITDFIYDIEEIVEQKVYSTMTEVSASSLGLDDRAGYRLYVSEDVIAVEKNRDGSLQYYGGFEYIDKEYRKELGNWVFYTTAGDDEDRVSECLSLYFESEE